MLPLHYTAFPPPKEDTPLLVWFREHEVNKKLHNQRIKKLNQYIRDIWLAFQVLDALLEEVQTVKADSFSPSSLFETKIADLCQKICALNAKFSADEAPNKFQKIYEKFKELKQKVDNILPNLSSNHLIYE